MTRVQPIRRSAAAGAFTLVELLIVIGIIAILISILVPVINKVRQSAYAADSRNQIQNIGNAIDRYYNDFQAYPGVFSNAAITAGVTVTYNNGTSVVSHRLTMSENLVLTLMGGITVPPTVGAAAPTQTTCTASYAELGRGPLTFNAVSQKRMSAYIEASPQIISMAGFSPDQGTTYGNAGTADVATNSGVPEFIDRFPGAMPIIYLRARVGSLPANGIADNGTDTAHYDVAQMRPYFDPYNPSESIPLQMPPYGINTKDFPANGTLAAGVDSYFGNASLSTTAIPVAKCKDTYMLISPGPDRKYGTADDICNFAF